MIMKMFSRMRVLPCDGRTPLNFKLIGFHSEPELADIVEVAHHYGVPVVHDLGSGALLDTAKYGLSHEPMVQESLAVGCDLVCFSGDKLLGGPQAGIIVGKAELIQRIQKHPLARALRSGKLTLAGITATLPTTSKMKLNKSCRSGT